MIGWAVFSADQIRRLIGVWAGTPPAPWLPGRASGLVATPILFLAYEFAYWLDHWLMHRVPLLWNFHKVHHQAESLSLLTNGRVHPVETIGFYNIVALVLGVTGALFDRLFGTFHMPQPERERLRFGVEDGETDPHGLRAALLEPFIAAARRLVPPRGPASWQAIRDRSSSR